MHVRHLCTVLSQLNCDLWSTIIHLYATMATSLCFPSIFSLPFVESQFSRGYPLCEICAITTNSKVFCLTQPREWNLYSTGLNLFCDKVCHIRNNMVTCFTQFVILVDMHNLKILFTNISIHSLKLITIEYC